MNKNSNLVKSYSRRFMFAALISLLILLGSTSAGAQPTVVEDFEDGDVAGWYPTGAPGPYGNGFIVTAATPVSPSGGNYVGKVTFGSSCWGPSRAFDTVAADYISFYFRADGDTGHDSGVGVFLSGSDGLIGKVSYHQGSLRYDRGLPYIHIVSASTGIWYLIEFRNIDWDSDTFDIWVDGVEYLVGASMNPSHDVYQVISYACPWVSGPMYLDDITFGFGEEGPFDQPPIADAGGPYTVEWGAALTLNGSGSTDPDNNIASYDWDLNADGIYDVAGVTTITSFTQIGDHPVTLRVTDDGGLSDTDTAIVTVTDPTLPAITSTASGTEGNNGWYTSDVTVSWDVSDPESGIASSVGCDTTTLTAETMGDTLTCSATNGAGLSNSASITILIDKTAPSITWVGDINDGDSFYFGAVPVAPTCTALDNLSGLDGFCDVSGHASTVGLHTLTATAKDNAGNQETETRTYTVLPWTLKGFYQPVDMNSVYNIVKNGSTVPLKFEIFAGTNELTDIVYIKSLTYAQTSCDANVTTDEIETTATGGTSLRYDAAAGQFVYNWKTPKTAGNCYRVTMTTIDGSTLMAYFKLK